MITVKMQATQIFYLKGLKEATFRVEILYYK